MLVPAFVCKFLVLLLVMLKLTDHHFIYLFAYLAFARFSDVLIPEDKSVDVSFANPTPLLQSGQLPPLG